MRLIDADALMDDINELKKSRWYNSDIRYNSDINGSRVVRSEVLDIVQMLCIDNAPTIDAVEVVQCKDCKHRPIKEDADGEDYGFNLIEPNDGNERCPCLVSDGWYSWMPKDDFYCGYGEREGE